MTCDHGETVTSDYGETMTFDYVKTMTSDYGESENIRMPYKFCFQGNFIAAGFI